ncbi:MAG: DNA starvation/stationary phase protection protein [Polaribacter sp.]|uniref:Dps family protein n=1 Tax=Polaribacter sp. TaxID=1920175 RepID=UPI0032672D13
MKTLELKVGLDQDYKLDVTKKLNILLADFQIYYMNLRGLHWNVKGRKFFLLHEKFEELYNNTNEIVDEIAERILTLGLTPYHTFEDYLENKTIKAILENLNGLLIHEREIIELAADHNDEGTASLMGDLISDQEKLVWMLNAYLS